MIKITNLNFKYKDNTKILNNINLEINEGEFVCIIGKNGSGKSTLARLISGIVNLSSGQILIDGISVSDKTMYLEIRKKIGIIFQNPESQIVFNNVYDEIAFGLNNLKILNIKVKIEEALKKVKMQDYINNDTYELSLGQKQRITIASVLAVNPKYIVFDEPTTMLDSEGKEDVYNILCELKKQGYTIIYITNQMDEILLSDKIVIMNKGTIIDIFKKDDILEHINILKENDVKLPMIIKTLLELENNGIDIKLKDWSQEELINQIVKVCKHD